MQLFTGLCRPFIVLFILASLNGRTQTIAVRKYLSTITLTLPSKILQEDRLVYIHCPKPDSTNKDKKYPVLYLMDGESHFEILSQYADYLSRWDVSVIPEMIVVGIVNTKRTRDLTPTSSIINYFGKPDTAAISWMKPSGGNENFLQFIRQELMPYISSHYNTELYSILAGHSFGGIAAINCMLTHPDMFNAYIAVSPSLWWDNQYLLKLAEKKLINGDILNKKLFYSDASEGVQDSSSFHLNLLQLDSLLKNKKIARLDLMYKYYPTETHMTEPVTAYYDALRFIYREWKEPVKK